MRSFLLNKLVRDKILADMQALGQQVTYHKLGNEEYLHELSKKLVEEAKEFDTSNPEEALKELADVLEVVEALAKQYGADFDKLRTLQAERCQKRGAFADRTYIERLDIADEDPWADHYAKDPTKFPPVE